MKGITQYHKGCSVNTVFPVHLSICCRNKRNARLLNPIFMFFETVIPSKLLSATLPSQAPLCDTLIKDK